MPTRPTLIVDGDQMLAAGGFLALRRLHLRTQRPDGTVSRPFVNDQLVRPYGQDAVIVAVHHRDAAGVVHVLLRDCMRPSPFFGRDAAAAPLPEEPSGLYQVELVAGIIETGDLGEIGLRARAAAETWEEAGFRVEPGSVILLGAGGFPSPGAMSEKFYFTAVEVDPTAQQEPPGDDSPMEEGGATHWRTLDEAIAASVRGELCDLKTELGLRRLRDHLAAG